MKEISSTRLHEIIEDCFKGDGSDLIKIEGVRSSFLFHGEKLAKYREELRQMIGLLNPKFLTAKEGGGGGWSFLNLPFDKNEHQWGEHLQAEILTVLCLASKLAARLMPIEMDRIMPGGMPYFVFSLLDDTFNGKAAVHEEVKQS